MEALVSFTDEQSLSLVIALSAIDHALWSGIVRGRAMHTDSLMYNSCFLLSKIDTKALPTVLLYQELHVCVHSLFTDILAFLLNEMRFY